MIKTVVFDLGGVYFQRGTRIFLPQLFNRLKASPETIKEVFTNYGQKEGWLFRRGLISSEEFWNRARERLDIDQEQAAEIRKDWYSSYQPIEGMPELVEELKERDYRVMVFSGNIQERIEFLDERYGICGVFDDLVLSYDFGLSKKDKDFYLILLQSLRCQPSEAVCVDDALHVIEKAEEMGMKAILFKNTEQARQELRELEVDI